MRPQSKPDEHQPGEPASRAGRYEEHHSGGQRLVGQCCDAVRCVVKGGAYVYGSYPDLDAMFEQQAVELDHGKRAEILARMQQILYERVIDTHLAACLHQ
jgi:hypothetical protein